jgi:hypothetical protein
MRGIRLRLLLRRLLRLRRRRRRIVVNGGAHPAHAFEAALLCRDPRVMTDDETIFLPFRLLPRDTLEGVLDGLALFVLRDVGVEARESNDALTIHVSVRGGPRDMVVRADVHGACVSVERPHFGSSRLLFGRRLVHAIHVLDNAISDGRDRLLGHVAKESIRMCVVWVPVQ